MGSDRGSVGLGDLGVSGCGTRVSSLGRSPPLKSLLWTAAWLSVLTLALKGSPVVGVSDM